MGLGGVEPPTSRLSGVRSNHLSYRPPCPAMICTIRRPLAPSGAASGAERVCRASNRCPNLAAYGSTRYSSTASTPARHRGAAPPTILLAAEFALDAMPSMRTRSPEHSHLRVITHAGRTKHDGQRWWPLAVYAHQACALPTWATGPATLSHRPPLLDATTPRCNTRATPFSQRGVLASCNALHSH